MAARHVRPRRSRRWHLGTAICAALPLALGCAARQYRLPMTAAELGAHQEGAALVAYLTQPEASPSVCDPRSAGPHLVRLDEDARKALSQAFHDGKIAPRIWAGCASAVLRGADEATAKAVAGDVLEEALAALEDRNLDFDAGEQGRLDALVQVYGDRPPGVHVRPDLADEAARALRYDVDSKRLGSAGRSRAADLWTLVQLERARWREGALDAKALDGMVDARDARTLGWAAVRAPDATLREEARRRIVRLHVRASPFAEVQADAAAVEEAVLRLGTNPVSLDRHPPVSAWMEPALRAARAVLVEQHLPEQSARLLGYSAERPTPAILPELPTRGNLHVAVEGVSIPITVCAPAEELDVTPCLAAAAIQVDEALATVDREGVLRFVDEIAETLAVDLAHRGSRLVLRFTIAGRRIAALEWPLRFERPPDLVLGGTGAGGRGPDLDVRVDARDPARLVYEVVAGSRRLHAVVERADATYFRVVSRGAPGRAGSSGSPGSDGTSGADGSSAVCPSFSGSGGSRGGDGAPGGAGGAGGPGGDGGDVRVSLTAASGARDEVLAVLRTTIRSEGGSGGRGGSGGAGGSGGWGGRGGSGTTCTDLDGHVTSLSGGTDGFRGSDGARGADGPPGAPGRPGRVTFPPRS
ncbi:MAG TPA: hypothetical protein VIV57_22180 [Anaeromyxobacter sp.]